MHGTAQLITHTDAKIGMACCNFEWFNVHFISRQQVIHIMCNMHDIAFINVKFHLPLGFPVTDSVYMLRIEKQYNSNNR